MEDEQQQPKSLRVPSAQEVLADLQKEQQGTVATPQAAAQPAAPQEVTPRVEPPNQVPPILAAMPKPAAQLMSQSDKDRIRKESQRTRQLIMLGLIGIVVVIVAFMVFQTIFNSVTEDLNPSESSGTSKVSPAEL